VTLTQNAVSGTGMGVVAWEPAWISNQQDWGQETIAFFDFTGHSQPAIDFFTFNYLF
jgi:arabinogalactan endo-1,4-beta-galactosidase